jgi:hypothetical protein
MTDEETAIPPHLLSWADAAIVAAQIAHPGLCRNGLAGERHDPLDRRCVATALAFILCGPVRRVQLVRGRGSYSLKHDAERWGRLIGFEPYVSNGDFIAAASYLKVPLRPDVRGTPNATIGLTLVTSACVGAGVLKRVSDRLAPINGAA